MNTYLSNCLRKIQGHGLLSDVVKAGDKEHFLNADPVNESHV